MHTLIYDSNLSFRNENEIFKSDKIRLPLFSLFKYEYLYRDFFEFYSALVHIDFKTIFLSLVSYNAIKLLQAIKRIQIVICKFIPLIFGA